MDHKDSFIADVHVACQTPRFVPVQTLNSEIRPASEVRSAPPCVHSQYQTRVVEADVGSAASFFLSVFLHSGSFWPSSRAHSTTLASLSAV